MENGERLVFDWVSSFFYIDGKSRNARSREQKARLPFANFTNPAAGAMDCGAASIEY